MNRQGRRWGSIIVVLVLFALTACGTKPVSPSSYQGEPDSANLTLRVEAGHGDTVAEATVTREDDQQVVVEVRVDVQEGSKTSETVVLEAEVQLDKPLGGRQVVDQEGRAIPQT